MTPRDDLKAAVVAALEGAMCDFPRSMMEVAFRAIESHAGGCVVVPREQTAAMLKSISDDFDAARAGNADIADIWEGSITASPYAPEEKPET